MLRKLSRPVCSCLLNSMHEEKYEMYLLDHLEMCKVHCDINKLCE